MRAFVILLLARSWVPAVLAQAASPQAAGSIRGTVTDPTAAAVAGALVTLQETSAAKRVTITGPAGAFRFGAVAMGTYTISIAAEGFATWTASGIAVDRSEPDRVVSAALHVAPASTEVVVRLPPRELAVQQVKAEEKQRLLGVFPNYFVSYEPDAAPLTVAQKFQLGWKTLIDPVTLLGAGVVAGIEQARNSYHEFGQGTEGYAKRFGAQYADAVNGIVIGGVLMQSVFRQDPRYFYKGRGGFRSRFLYAVATAFVTKGDNGHWQFDYSDMIGGLAANEIATLYYPASSRTGLRLFHGVLLDFAGRASGNLFEEFLARRITSHVPKTLATMTPAVLREGTAVSLISAEDLASKTAADSGPVAFVLAGDIVVGSAVVAQAGSKAQGRAVFAGSGQEGELRRLQLDGVHIQIGGADVPLRSSPRRGAGGPLDYHRVEDTGRIALTLYVARNVSLPPGAR
ncbi:MAG TPA: carboxypeptidase-like regulatory domain-containing protein [Bryobacteraceae bacterium]|nr:carboxypeptidase-like regulatory domain-containing protein [Bryobacteraceae bacterium]